ncbi:putative transmembrane protein [Heterostelium album PN500]|uniref:Putative transmembrane protein n=1 Tax=Heterostelium pallidum (strain ATCC 26659 / Pp 5 / PN500) TaxID=670386 RepID=D3AYC0_HETP5|nr:putative transmembrane protein [Heterostelium album PN500]EFA85947.1 putative transmembrane protein [Heterostelium album PN500]|eukprot:XP_020438053.1 putative transmembrane protein [Heterostelium album PN500]
MTEVLKYSPALVGSDIPNLTSKSKNLKEESRPLVLLYGWMGSQPVYLNKYAQQWTQRGYNVFAYCPSTLETFFPPYRVKQINNKMLPIVKGYIKDHPQCQGIIFHCFSNGGGFYYSEIIHEMVNNPEFQHLHQFMKGTVFDSLPSLSMNAGLRAARISGGLLVYLFVKILMFPLMILFMGDHWERYKRNLSHEKNVWPHLVIYSKDDSIVTVDQVEILIDLLKNKTLAKKPNLYLETCFDNSPHVCHLRTHPKEYGESMDQLVERIFQHATEAA